MSFHLHVQDETIKPYYTMSVFGPLLNIWAIALKVNLLPKPYQS